MLKWAMGFFLLMMIGVIAYLFITGEFLSGGTLPFFSAFASELGITVHDLGFGVAMLIMVGMTLIGVPLLILIVRLAE